MLTVTCTIVRAFAEMAGVLGNVDDEQPAQCPVKAFNNKFWDEQKGGYGTNNQSCNFFVIFLGAPDKNKLPRVIIELLCPTP